MIKELSHCETIKGYLNLSHPVLHLVVVFLCHFLLAAGDESHLLSSKKKKKKIWPEIELIPKKEGMT